MFAALADTAIVNGEILDYALVTAAIRQVLGTTDLRHAHIVAAVGGHDVIVKKMTLERTTASQALELVRWEAEQHIPFDMKTALLDFQILDPDAIGPEMQVLLVAAKRELVLSTKQLLINAGANPHVLDVDAFALLNAFSLNHPEAMVGTVALLNIGNEVTNLNILEDGIPLLIRDLRVGTRRLREELRRDDSTNPMAWDLLFRERERSHALDRLVAPCTDEIAMGVERASAFLMTSTQQFTPLRAIYVCGGGAGVPGMRALLAERLHLSVMEANPLARVAVESSALQEVSAADLGPLLMLPVGLALRTAA